MRNSNTARSTKKDGGKLVSWAPRSGGKFRCNICKKKIKKNQLISHESSHTEPKVKSNKNLERINSEVREIVETILNTKKVGGTRHFVHQALNKNGTLNRFYELMKTVERLPEQEKAKVNHKSIREIKKELGN